MKELIIKLSHTDKQALGTVRTHTGLRVAVDGEWLWLRGVEAKEKIDPAIRQLPGIQSYEMDEQENLFPTAGLTPVGKLKKLFWQPIGEFIAVELPVSAMPGKIGQQYQNRIRPSITAREGQALLTTLALWKDFAAMAPEVRLHRLRFALSDKGEVLIWGTPLPAMPGKEYWMQENMLLPAGFDFEIPWIASLVAAKLNPLNDSLILFNEEGSWEKIPKNAFVPATRSAVRLTEENR